MVTLQNLICLGQFSKSSKFLLLKCLRFHYFIITIIFLWQTLKHLQMVDAPAISATGTLTPTEPGQQHALHMLHPLKPTQRRA